MKNLLICTAYIGLAVLANPRSAVSQAFSNAEENGEVWFIDYQANGNDDPWIRKFLADLPDYESATPDERSRRREAQREGWSRAHVRADDARRKIAGDEVNRLERLPPPYKDLVRAERVEARDRQERARARYANPDNRVYVEYNGVLQPLQGWALVEQYDEDGNLLREGGRGSDTAAIRVPTRVDDVRRQLERERAQRGASGLRIAPATPSDWMIRSDARVTQGLNVPSLRPAFVLPAPRGRNDLFYNPLDPRSTRLGSAVSPLNWNRLRAAKDAGDLFWTQLNVEPSFEAAFDTGFVAGGAFDVPMIALGRDPEAGQTRITADDPLDGVPVNLLFDTQATNVRLSGLGDQQLQFYLDANNFENRDNLRFENMFLRTWNKESTNLLAGKAESLFAGVNFVPTSLLQSVNLIGTSSLNQNSRSQLRLQQTPAEAGGWGWGMAVEDAYEEDTFIPLDGTRLGRWPSFSGNVVFSGANPVNRVQFSMLLRHLGFEAVGGEEFFDTGWGLSAYARHLVFYDECSQGALFLGVAGGEGVGEYIQGIGTSAVFDGGSLAALEALGTYVGYSQRWFNRWGWKTGTNMAYGYATLDPRSVLPDDTNRILHQAFANLLVFPSQHVAVGFEYQYGRRETIGMGAGEDNRFLFVVRLSKDAEERTNQRYQDSLGRSVDMAGRTDAPARELRRGVAGYAHRQAL